MIARIDELRAKLTNILADVGATQEDAGKIMADAGLIKFAESEDEVEKLLAATLRRYPQYA
jgi:hypothetical protein